MGLLKFELYKLFAKRSVWITTVLLLTLYAMLMFVQRYGLQDGSKYYEPYKENVSQYYGPTKGNEVTNKLSEYTSGGQEKNQNQYGVFQDIINIYYGSERYYENLDETKKSLETANLNSYQRMETQLKLQKLQEAGPPPTKVIYNKPWGYVLDFIDQFGVLFMGVMILIGVVPIFSEEYMTGVYPLLMSSKKGRRQTVSAKILAAFLYTVLFCSLFAGIHLLVQYIAFGNLAGAGTSFKTVGKYIDSLPFWNSVYSFKVIQYYFIQLLFHLLGSLAFTSIVLLISALCISPLIALAVSASILFMPYYFILVKYNQSFLNLVADYSYGAIMGVTKLFSSFKAVNIFGTPYMYANVLTCVMGLLTICSLVFVYFIFPKRQVR